MKTSRVLLLGALLALILSGCATVPPYRTSVSPGSILTMKASDFRFDPNTIEVRGTGTITLTITNTGGTSHNITIDDPGGKVIDSAAIPPRATITTHVAFSAPGSYYFFCNHPFHAELGMKGHFIVAGG